MLLTVNARAGCNGCIALGASFQMMMHRNNMRNHPFHTPYLRSHDLCQYSNAIQYSQTLFLKPFLQPKQHSCSPNSIIQKETLWWPRWFASVCSEQFVWRNAALTCDSKDLATLCVIYPNACGLCCSWSTCTYKITHALKGT